MAHSNDVIPSSLSLSLQQLKRTMKKVLTYALIFFSSVAFSQDSTAVETEKSPWKLKSTFGLNGTQSSFVNWAAGGRNNITILGFIDASAHYEKKNWKWDNDLGIALGGLKYIDVGDKLQKTDDRIDLASNIGHRLKDHWYFSFVGGFRSQFIDGYNYPNDSVRVSKFMAPGYVNLSLGIDYSPNENFTLFVAPIATKMTFVQDRTMADAGAYGVDAAEYDLSTGELLKAGSKFRFELGAYLKAKYNATIAKNIEMKSKLELFSNYLENPENIDVNAEVIFNFKVNSWFSASLNWTLIYDDDIDIRDSKGNVGPRTQFKSVIGLGISYTLRNFKEEKE